MLQPQPDRGALKCSGLGFSIESRGHAGKATGPQAMTAIRAYKRSPDLSNSTWYKGILNSQIAGLEDNNGAFDLLIVKMRRGTEPPPHVHSREDELFHLFAGEVTIYADGKTFHLKAGDYMFMPRDIPHAFLATSEEIHFMAFITPGGFLSAINKMNAPAGRMEIPASTDTLTYANSDLSETFRLLEQYGLRFLTNDEIRTVMPEFPLQEPG
jgi:quercetin dioxygenase-like cupin family protein